MMIPFPILNNPENPCPIRFFRSHLSCAILLLIPPPFPFLRRSQPHPFHTSCIIKTVSVCYNVGTKLEEWMVYTFLKVNRVRMIVR